MYLWGCFEIFINILHYFLFINSFIFASIDSNVVECNLSGRFREGFIVPKMWHPFDNFY